MMLKRLHARSELLASVLHAASLFNASTQYCRVGRKSIELAHLVPAVVDAVEAYNTVGDKFLHCGSTSIYKHSGTK